MSLFALPPVIVCSKRAGAKPIPKGYTPVLIDRETVFGNPVECLVEGDRDQSIDNHRKWLKKQIKQRTIVYKELKKLVGRIRKGEKIALVCWCKPKRCHGDNYLDYINYLLKKGKKNV